MKKVLLDPEGVLHQALRYLAASVQDTHPLFGVVHANYARILLEELARAGAPVTGLVAVAGKVQKQWSLKIMKKMPLSELPAVRDMAKFLGPGDIAALRRAGYH